MKTYAKHPLPNPLPQAGEGIRERAAHTPSPAQGV